MTLFGGLVPRKHHEYNATDDSDQWTIEGSLYPYDPSLPVAILGVILFTLVSLVLFYQYFKYRAWFLWALVIGMGMECFGFLLRAVSANNVHKLLPFTGAYLLILLAPSFLAASCYGAFGRVLWFATPSASRNLRTLWVPPRWITPIFVTFDFVSFAIQLVGGGRVASSFAGQKNLSPEEIKKRAESGRSILLAGLSMQLACFGIFAIIGARFLWVSRKWVVQIAEGKAQGGTGAKWRSLNWAINAAATLITLRAFYRIFEVPEQQSGATNYLSSHEWAFWVLDALPIFVTLVLFAAFHPGRILPSQYVNFRLNRRAIIQSKSSMYEYTINNPVQSDTELGPVPTGQANYYGYGSRGARY